MFCQKEPVHTQTILADLKRLSRAKRHEFIKASPDHAKRDKNLILKIYKGFVVFPLSQRGTKGDFTISDQRSALSD